MVWNRTKLQLILLWERNNNIKIVLETSLVQSNVSDWTQNYLKWFFFTVANCTTVVIIITVISTDNTQLDKYNTVCLYSVLLHVSTVYTRHHQVGTTIINSNNYNLLLFLRLHTTICYERSGHQFILSVTWYLLHDG